MLCNTLLSPHRHDVFQHLFHLIVLSICYLQYGNSLMATNIGKIYFQQIYNVYAACGSVSSSIMSCISKNVLLEHSRTPTFTFGAERPLFTTAIIFLHLNGTRMLHCFVFFLFVCLTVCLFLLSHIYIYILYIYFLCNVLGGHHGSDFKILNDGLLLN